MFEGLKKALRRAASLLSEKEISERDIEKVASELEISLIANDVAVPVAREIVNVVRKALIGARVRRFSDMRKVFLVALRKTIEKIFLEPGSIDILALAQQRREENLKNLREGGEWRPYVILFLGPNGAGKTLTVAKLAFLLKKNGLTPVLAAADTFRAGAIEQLEKHAKNLRVTLIRREYGSDPASVAYDAIGHARARKKDAVLIDTAGRLGTNIDLMDEMKKIARVSNPDLKVFVIDALAGNDLVNQAQLFKKHVGIDANILTKVDADVRGGAAISLVYVTRAPIAYIGVGQEYKDLKPFNPNWFIDRVLAV